MQPQNQAVFDAAKAHFVRSLAFIQEANWMRAEFELQQSLRLIPDRISSLTNLSTVLLKLGKYPEAGDVIAKVLAVDPHNAEAMLNEGALLNENKEYKKALGSCERAIKRHPERAEAWANRANALRGLGRLDEAITQYEHAIALDNKLSAALRGLMECHRHLNDFPRLFEVADRHRAFIERDYLCSELLGYVYQELGDRENAFNAFSGARKIAEITPQENTRTEWPVLPSRLKHDCEQLSYLEAQGANTQAGKKALAVIKRRLSDALPRSTPEEDAQLLQGISGYHHVPDLPFSGPALATNDYREIEATFLNGKIRLVVIDNFLTEEALLNLRRFCNEATVWKRSYSDGYVGSFIGTGFCSRVILEIAHELKLAMPNVIGSNSLSHAWGFKYDQGMKGINLHADFAKVNTNFWITPDEACLDKSNGGLVVYDVPAPDDWGFYAYNCDQNKIQAYLTAKQSRFVRVPYRCNRCVLFDSTYFHVTDDFSFADGYTNRRVNCTLLYGRAL